MRVASASAPTGNLRVIGDLNGARHGAAGDQVRALERRAIERRQVEVMKEYAEQVGCRWNFVLEHFGEGGPESVRSL